MTTDEIKSLIIDYANGAGIYPEIALAQAQRESNFNPNRTGGDGERGLMQILPATWPRFAPAGVGFDQAFDPDYNLSAWAAYMTWLLTRYNWNYTLALEGYNGGEGNVDRGTVSSTAQNYASGIIAASGLLNVSDSGGSPTPPDAGSIDWSTIAIAIALLFVVFRR